MKLVWATVGWSLASLAIILGLGSALAGWRGAVAGSLGVGLADLDLISLGFFSGVLAIQQPGLRTVRLCMAFLVIKLPLLAAAVWLAVRLGPPALACFLGGTALVYFALVHVAIRGAVRRQPDPFS